MGLGTLYKSSDRLETVRALPAQGNTQPFTSIAYGGSESGGGHKEVFYATAGNTVYVGRPTAAGAAQVIKKETIAGVLTINQVVMDPLDYDIAFVTTDKGVYKRSGGATGTWTLISQNLLNANLQAITFIPKENLQLRGGRDAAGRAPRRRRPRRFPHVRPGRRLRVGRRAVAVDGAGDEPAERSRRRSQIHRAELRELRQSPPAPH